MQDIYKREINYLRVSVTDRCNLRCVYCMPAQGVKPIAHREILRLEEIETVARAAAGVGIRRIRLTGGDPLVRKGLEELVRRLAGIPGLDDLSLTTNGLLLSSRARVLREAGLQRVNISLDTLDAGRFRIITRGGDLSAVRAGIQAALEAGLSPVKLNTVLIRGFNDDEAVAMARLTMTKRLHVRFIELMPIGSSSEWTKDRLVPAWETMRRIENKLGQLLPVRDYQGGGPARYYRIKDAAGTVGFISAMSEHFCHTCNRLRLTPAGGLRPCLFDGREVDLRSPLRDGAGLTEIAALIRGAVALKPGRHGEGGGWQEGWREMSQIGG
ncbi:MAG TPA: GTP 3',8-cyclase MoaA [Spirochaetia bacterium]|nr:GTP 3',8-cyclase MoaA [Spirochaetia bacterium]